MMRILIASDAPFQPSSWGQQVKLLAPRLQAAGHSCVIYAPSYYGEELHFEGMTVLGGNGDMRGDLMGEYAERINADIVLTMKNLHIYNAQTLRTLRVPWVPLVAVETEPLSAWDRGQLTFATMPLAMSRNGQEQMAADGIRSLYAPLGIDTAFWTPGDVQAARERWHILPTAFVAAFVGANAVRKGIDNLLIAWSAFIEQAPETRQSVLLLHTPLVGDVNHGQFELKALLTSLDIPSVNLRVTDQLGLHNGTVPAEYIRDMYRAADVLVLPSRGEGFGLPLLEAQACGTPPISVQWTAMRETNWSGWQVSTIPGKAGGEPVWHESGGFQFRASGKALLQCLNAAFEGRGNPQQIAAAEDGAKRYDIDYVVQEYWLPALDQIEKLLKGAKLFAVPEVGA